MTHTLSLWDKSFQHDDNPELNVGLTSDKSCSWDAAICLVRNAVIVVKGSYEGKCLLINVLFSSAFSIVTIGQILHLLQLFFYTHYSLCVSMYKGIVR